MNRRGAILHWIMFGLLISLGVFFLASRTGFQQIEEKGQWSLDFLQQNYLAAEKQLLNTSIMGKNVGMAIALQLANHGGFQSDESTTCGTLAEVRFWNKEDTFCFPDIQKNINILGKERLTTELHKEFSAAGYSGPLFFGKGPMETIQTNSGRYTFENSFAVNLGYSFDEYSVLETEAQQLLNACRNQRELGNCLRDHTTGHWHYKSCDREETIPSVTRTLAFCVESPTQVILQGVPIRYHLGLDFTPTIALSITEFSAQQSGTRYLIQFPPDTADSYMLHYTNWPQAAGKSGTVEEVFSALPAALGFFHQTVSIPHPATTYCPAEKAAGNTYLCVSGTNTIIYVLEDARIVPGETYFTLTTVSKGRESAIDHFEPLGPIASIT